MKVLVKAGLHEVRRELRFLQEVIDEDWKEKSDTEMETESNVDMTEDCIGMVIAIFVYYFSINNINATQILYYTADK